MPAAWSLSCRSVKGVPTSTAVHAFGAAHRRSGGCNDFPIFDDRKFRNVHGHPVSRSIHAVGGEGGEDFGPHGRVKSARFKQGIDGVQEVTGGLIFNALLRKYVGLGVCFEDGIAVLVLFLISRGGKDPDTLDLILVDKREETARGIDGSRRGRQDLNHLSISPQCEARLERQRGDSAF